jgi:glycerol-3-phosphate acyltransferase PlsY
MGLFILFVVLAYFSGSVPFAKIAGYFYGVDIQKKGSGNIGFANAVRVLGWKPGIAVLLGDVLKGFVPIAAASNYVSGPQLALVGLAAICGHLFPVWLKFKGGKGIATGLGVTFAINPVLGICGVSIYLLGFYFFRKSALSSIMAAWGLPLGCFFLMPAYIGFYFSLALIATWTHRSNIRQVLNES